MSRCTYTNKEGNEMQFRDHDPSTDGQPRSFTQDTGFCPCGCGAWSQPAPTEAEAREMHLWAVRQKAPKAN